MRSRWRSFQRLLESLVFAGLKPGAPAPVPRADRAWLAALRRGLDRMLGGGAAPDDPLYLSNRTWGQKLRLAAIICAPVLVIIILVALVATYVLPAPDKRPAKVPPAQVAAKTLPDLTGLKLPEKAELEVVEVQLQAGLDPPVLTGAVRNKSARRYQSAEVAFALTDRDGSQVGAATTKVHNVEPYGLVRFQIPLKPKNVAYALVTDVRGQ